MAVKERIKLIRLLNEAKTDATGLQRQLTLQKNRVAVISERITNLIAYVENLDKQVAEEVS